MVSSTGSSTVINDDSNVDDINVADNHDKKVADDLTGGLITYI